MALNAHYFLKTGGHIVVSIKASCIDSTAAPEAVFQKEVCAVCCMALVQFSISSVCFWEPLGAFFGITQNAHTPQKPNSIGEEAAGGEVQAPRAADPGALRARPRRGGGHVPAHPQGQEVKGDVWGWGFCGGGARGG